MQDGYDFDYVCFDESSEFPPAGVDWDNLSEIVRAMAEGIASTLSALGDYLSGAFAPVSEAVRDAISAILEGLPAKPRKRYKPVRRTYIFCLYRSFHSDRIPYYTAGFL